MKILIYVSYQDMRQYLSLTLLVGAFAVALMALFGDDSYERLSALSRNIKSQQDSNSILESKVAKLQSEIAALRFDDQELERRARKELGLARPNELIFRFDTALDESEDSPSVTANEKPIDSKSALKKENNTQKKQSPNSALKKN